MNRRTFLSCGSPWLPLLAGCVRDPGEDTDGGRRVSIADVDDLPDLPVRPSVDVSAARATDDAPPQLRATVTNIGGDPLEVGEKRAIVFAYVHSEERPGLVLLPEPAGDYTAVRKGCWRLAEPVAVPEYYGVVSLAPGDAVSRSVGVWASPDRDGCLPTGRFRFEATYSVARDLTPGLDAPDRRARWGFSIAIA